LTFKWRSGSPLAAINSMNPLLPMPASAAQGALAQQMSFSAASSIVR
jgi:hypothetical protein